jgi:hypothetical protein
MVLIVCLTLKWDYGLRQIKKSLKIILYIIWLESYRAHEFQNKSKTKIFSQHTTLAQTTRARKNERNKKNNVRMLFFVMFVNVLLFMRQYNIFFSGHYFIDEKKNEMMVIRFKLIKPIIILWVHCSHIRVPPVHNSSMDASFWFICFWYTIRHKRRELFNL